MIKYKFNIADALERKGFNTYKAKTSGLISQNTFKKLKEENTNISIKSLNNICTMLDLQPKDILIYEETEADKNNLKKL